MDERDVEDSNEKAGNEGKLEGQNPKGDTFGTSSIATKKEYTDPQEQHIMEVVLEYANIETALKRVIGNRGASGIDGITVGELRTYFSDHWQRIQIELMEGRYKPTPVKGVEIPKPNGGGMRKLGIPTTVDRVIQQALHQVLSPIFEEDFSEYSYGFRPGRSTHQAILKAKEYIAGGKRWVVDIDLEKFFDRVNHDILMSRIARKIKDKRVLRLIRSFLQVGIMENGLESARVEGTPQGGPLSPLLSNIMLHELDQELERRGHTFCRFADDCNIYVQSEKAGQRVMESIREFLETKLKLKVNEKKSAVARPWERKFLAYSFTSKMETKLKPAKESIKKMKDKIREKCRRGRGQNLKEFIKRSLNPLIRGLANYFKLVEAESSLTTLDGWIRRKLRCIIWRQQKSPHTRMKALIKGGVIPEAARETAWSGKGPWRCSRNRGTHQAYSNKYFKELGLCSLLLPKELVS